MATVAQLESILFVSSGPLSRAKLAKLLAIRTSEVGELVDMLKAKWQQTESGIVLLENGEHVQLMSHPDNSELVAQFLKDETTGELTRPSLETLAIIAYRQPITKPELEQIRGVNCSLILRNLLMRGLIIEQEDAKRMQSVYAITMDFLRLLGINSVKELPDFADLHNHQYITDVLAQISENPS